ncbi:MAG: hypothetical protein AAFV53_14310 [Myxococcota bacterium]
MSESSASSTDPNSASPQDPLPLSLRAWQEPYRREDRAEVALCISAGGFRSFCCGIGQVRALRSMGIFDQIDLLSAVSGGAWFASALAFAQNRTDLDNLLGEYVPPQSLTAEALQRLDARFIGAPIAEMSVISLARQIVEKGYSLSRLFGECLQHEALEPLGLTQTLLMASDHAERDALLQRNPHLTADQIAVSGLGKTRLVAGAALGFHDDGYERFYHVELEPGRLVLGSQVDTPLYAVEAAALACNVGPQHEGVFDTTLSDPNGFGLAQMWTSTGGAPFGVFARLAALFNADPWDIVPPQGDWLGEGSFLVDGGYVEGNGVLAALRRGANRLIVCLNLNSAFGTRSNEHVQGMDGQITHLFGKPPRSGLYKDSDIHIFATAELDDLELGFRTAQTLGEIPWALVEHTIPENRFGIAPRRVNILWILNETPQNWAAHLPNQINTARRVMRHSGGVPHLPVAFAHQGYMFRLEARQINLMAQMHDYAMRSLRPQLDALLEWNPPAP